MTNAPYPTVFISGSPQEGLVYMSTAGRDIVCGMPAHDAKPRKP